MGCCRYGTQILLSTFENEPLAKEARRGSVVSRTGSQIMVSFQDAFDVDDMMWRSVSG